MVLKVGQWNARSAYSTTSLKQLLLEEKFDILLLSETWYKAHYDIKYKGFQVLRKDRPDGKGGVAILISNKISYKPIAFNDTFTNKIEVSGASVRVDDKDIFFVSVYRPPNVKVSSVDNINFFNQIPDSVLVGGDCNAHHGLWGSSISNHDGAILTEALDDFPNFVIGNTGAATRLSPPDCTNHSVVDITILSSDLIEALS